MGGFTSRRLRVIGPTHLAPAAELASLIPSAVSASGRCSIALEVRRAEQPHHSNCPVLKALTRSLTYFCPPPQVHSSIRGGTERVLPCRNTKIPRSTSFLLFSSFHFLFQRSAASTAIGSIGSLPSLTLARINCITFSRPFASKRGMGPKKKEEEKKVLLGRPGNSLKSGIVCMDPQFVFHLDRF